MFDFTRPLLLWGLLGVAAPVLIHLLGRRRVRTVPVATLRFLERARARASAHWKIRRLLLLLARAAALACLAFLFAGPGCEEAGRSAGPTTWVLILDTSPSMASKHGSSTSLDAARAELLRVVDRSDPRDRFLVATTLEASGGEDGWRRGFTADRGAVRRTLERAKVEYGPHRADRALERAFRLVEGAEGGQVLLATDLQASAWGEDRVAGAGRAPLRLVDVGNEGAANAWVAGVEETADSLRVRLGFSGASAGAVRRTVRLRLEDGQSFTAFSQGSETVFRARVPAGLHTGEAVVEPGGDLALDDRVALVSRGCSKVRVLLVNGDPRGFEIRDELFFVRRALTPGGRLGERFEAKEVRASDLLPTDLDSADVALLANPGTLGGALAEALRSRAERGMGVVVAVGDRWGRGDAGKSLGAVLAVPLRDVITLTGGDASRRPHESLDPTSFSGPLASFRNREAGDLGQSRVWTYWVPESRTLPAGTTGPEVLLRLENGAPLILDRRIGKGRSLLVTTTLDKDGSDLCLQPAFVPWLERLLLHAAGRLRPTVGRQAAAGYPLALPYTAPVSIEGPEGFQTAWAPGAPPFVPPVPGVYRVKEADVLVDGFAAGLDASESDLTRLDRPGLDARLGADGYDLGDDARATRKGATGRRDVSTRFGAVLLLALAAEGALAARWGFRRRRKAALLEGDA